MEHEDIKDHWRNGDRAVKDAVLELAAHRKIADFSSTTDGGLASIVVGSLLRAGWVLVPPAKEQTKPRRPPDWLFSLIEAREKARRAGDYKKADSLRDEIRSKGYDVADTPNGPEWRRLPSTQEKT